MRKLTRATPDVNRTTSRLVKAFVFVLLLVLDSAHSVYEDDDEEDDLAAPSQVAMAGIYRSW
jgi:hypothetical protein